MKQPAKIHTKSAFYYLLLAVEVGWGHSNWLALVYFCIPAFSILLDMKQCDFFPVQTYSNWINKSTKVQSWTYPEWI